MTSFAQSHKSKSRPLPGNCVKPGQSYAANHSLRTILYGSETTTDNTRVSASGEIGAARASVQRKAMSDVIRKRNRQTPVEVGQGTANESVLDGLYNGEALPETERTFFEPRFGRAFDNVRIHDGATAEVAAKSLNARAFTHGHDIAFAQGEYRPGTAAGRRLLAHELTHTLQQDSASSVVQRDLALEPTVPDAVPRTLTDEEYEEAIRYNRLRIADPHALAIIEDIIGPVTDAHDIDRDFIERVVSLQASFGLQQDGMVGERTTELIERELHAEHHPGDAGRVHADLMRYLIRLYRSRAVQAMQRAAARVRAAGTAPPAGNRVLTAHAVAFRRRSWATDQPHILAQIESAIVRLQGIDIVVVETAADLPQITDPGDRAFATRILNTLPAANMPSLNTIVLFQDWVSDTSLRTTRLIHESFHGLPDRVPGGAGGRTTIEHGPHPWDNAFAFQYFVSEITGVHFDRGVVTRHL